MASLAFWAIKAVAPIINNPVILILIFFMVIFFGGFIILWFLMVLQGKGLTKGDSFG
jgi:hypothetical protein